MKRSIYLTSAAVVIAGLFAARIASAQTAAGTSISNSATINYQVGGTDQDPVDSNAVTFVVDRKIDLTVATTDVSEIVVTPGTSGNVLTFTVTNTGNGTQDFALSSTALDGGSGAFGGTDSIDASAVAIYVESGATGGYQSGEDTATYIDELAAGGSKTVYIVSTFATGLSNAAIASYHLVAEAREGGAAASLGSTLTETAGADDPDVVDIVFADGQGTDTTNDLSRDAKYSTQSDYEVFAATLSVAKTSVVISDPVNSTTDPKAIPGAVIEYTITIDNAAGSATATSITVTDDLDTEITTNGTLAFSSDGYASGNGIQVTAPNLYSGAPTNLTNASDSDEGSFNSGTNVVTVSGIALDAGESATVKFRVIVQ